MLEDLLIQIVSDPYMAACAAAMVCLFLYDFAGVVAKLINAPAPKHVDFKSPIVAIGVFGTFSGILTGLYGFDSTHIDQSVPRLLVGLKFAFATSVLGMFLSLILQVLHKLVGTGQSESDVLYSIDDKLSLIENRMGSLVTSLESPTELVNQFNAMKEFLENQLREINKSLSKALEQLASGATKEVILALEKVITDFNQNLQEQFGENFKELNAACLKLVEWQRKYKDHVDTAEGHLIQVRSTLDETARAALEIIASQQETKNICREVAGLISTYDIQVKTLATYLESCKRLGEEAKDFLVNTQHSINRSSDNLASFADTIEHTVRKQSDTLATLTQDLENQLPKALGELEDVLTNVTNQFAGDYRSLFEYITAKR